MQTGPTELDEARKELAHWRAVESVRRSVPSHWYEPHAICARNPIDPALAGYGRMGRPSGQLQFHQSAHAIRVMAPGNGWGGTTAMGCEIDAWMRHDNRWQQTPQWPISALWVAPTLDQFDQVYKDVLRPACWGETPRLKPHGPTGRGSAQFVWPDGGSLVVITHRTAWLDIQGINPDIVAFDEVPPYDMWVEFLQRRRGRKKTRFVCKATQTEGWSWMGDVIYKPWLDFHAALGIAEEQALDEQRHPSQWVWSRGGIHDNPGCDESDIREYEARSFRSPKERKVRLFGGFESFVGDCIFEEAALDAARAELPALTTTHGPGEEGMLMIDDNTE